MAFSRYKMAPKINLGTQLGTSSTVMRLRTAIKSGRIQIVRTIVTTGADRLDTLSGDVYGDGRYWWVLAAGSDIGWGLQVPVDTAINVVNLSDVESFLG